MKKLFLLILIIPLALCAQKNKSGTLTLRKQNAFIEANYGEEREFSSSTEVFTITEVMPEFPGGQKALINYLRDNIKYPKEAKLKKISGKVYVSCTIKKDGTISDIIVLKSVNDLLNKEAIRVIKSMPKWKPGTQRGKPVNTTYKIPVKFSLK